jgi:The GLUG motif.
LRRSSRLAPPPVGSFLIVCLALLWSCSAAFVEPSSSSVKPSSLTISIDGSPSRTIVAGTDDYSNAIKGYKISVSNADNSYESTTVSSGTCTITGIAAGSYTVAARAYSDAGYANQIAYGEASSVEIAAGATKNISITLSFSQAASTGGFSLALAWPVSTGLAYVSATIDGAAIAVPAVTAGAADYSATLKASGLQGGARLLRLYFKSSAGATTVIGPYIEAVNVWDGVTDTMWADSSGDLHSALTLVASDFADSGAALADLSVATAGLSSTFASTTYAYNFGTLTTGTTYSFTVTTGSASQGVTCAFNGAAITLTASSPTVLTGSFTAAAGSNNLSFVVTAPNRQTTATYTVSTTLLTSANLAASIGTAGKYVLTEDIDLSATTWTPVGTTTTPFAGSFDGKGHSVTLAITGTANNSGFFGYIGSTGSVKNLVVAGAVAGGGGVGALAGYSEGLVSACSSTANVTGTTDVGGLVGKNGNTTGIIEYCHSSGTVAGTNYVGGLLGENSTYATVRYCYSTCAITSGSNVGGLVGFNWYSTILDSYARGAVTGTAPVGGLIGRNQGSSVTRCYATGTSSGNSFVGSEPESNTYKYCYARTAQGTMATVLAVGDAPADWDFTTIWNIDTTTPVNNGYPYLRYFGAATVTP